MYVTKVLVMISRKKLTKTPPTKMRI